nr:unnamed protein product [Digitaria exilis]
MEVVNTPSQELALTNCAFVSAGDLRRFPNSIALVGDALLLTLRYPQPVSLVCLSCCFVPPEDFKLALLTLELSFVKAKANEEQLDAVLLAQQLRKRFLDQVINQKEAASSKLFKHKEFNLEKLGIGGLSAEFTDIFRRAFASRVFPPHVVSRLGIKHVKGILLYGPPEKNVRDLFADAENEQRTRGDESDLHVIIFDEIDAICKSRGSTRDGTGVHDSIVNQLLTKIDGVEALNNVLLIGMTNRKDLLDEALLRLRGIVDCGKPHKHIYQRAMLLVEQVKVSRGSPLVTCLLEGPAGSGKSAMAATVGIDSDFAYVKVVFEDAYKSPLSIIILDDIERLLEYVAIGPRFSNLISQTLLVLLKRVPPKGKNLLVIGTTSEVGFLESIGMCDVFSVTYHVPKLKKEDAKKVLQHLNVFDERDIDAAAEALDDMPLKKLYTLIEMAAQGRTGGSAEAIYAGKEKIDIDHFFSIFGDIIRY